MKKSDAAVLRPGWSGLSELVLGGECSGAAQNSE